MIDYVKNLVSQYKIHFIYGCIVLVLLGALVLQYKFSKNSTSTPPVATITDTTPAGVAEGQAAVNKYTGAADAADVSDLIHKAQAKQPTATYKTSTQAAADKQAQQLAKADKADYMLKQTSQTAVPKIGEVAAENSATRSEEITNNYYAIQQERKHRLAAGITVFRNEPCVSVMYTNDRLTFGLHSKDLKDIDGVTLAYTVKKW